MSVDTCEHFIDALYAITPCDVPVAESANAGEVRCRRCGDNTFEQIGTATVAYKVVPVAGFDHQATPFRASDLMCFDDDLEPLGYRCASCGIYDHDLTGVAEMRPWEIGARTVLPDGTESRVEAVGPDRVVGNHREPTAVCGGGLYLLRELLPIEPVHPEQLSIPNIQ